MGLGLAAESVHKLQQLLLLWEEERVEAFGVGEKVSPEYLRLAPLNLKPASGQECQTHEMIEATLYALS